MKLKNQPLHMCRLKANRIPMQGLKCKSMEPRIRGADLSYQEEQTYHTKHISQDNDNDDSLSTFSLTRIKFPFSGLA